MSMTVIKIKGVDIFIDPTSSAVRDQIYESIAGAIKSGALPAGSELPTLPEIAKPLRTSVVTVSAACIRLANEGLVVRRFGKSHIVAHGKKLSEAKRIMLLRDAVHSLRVKAARLGINLEDLLSKESKTS